jgi:hypothetical protein
MFDKLFRKNLFLSLHIMRGDINMNFEFLNKYIENVEVYLPQLAFVADFLDKHQVEVNPDNFETFWNHIATLLERITTKAQNELEIPDEHGLMDRSLELAAELDDAIKMQFGSSSITEFEKFLIALYIDQFLRKENTHE